MKSYRGRKGRAAIREPDGMWLAIRQKRETTVIIKGIFRRIAVQSILLHESNMRDINTIGKLLPKTWI